MLWGTLISILISFLTFYKEQLLLLLSLGSHDKHILGCFTSLCLTFKKNWPPVSDVYPLFLIDK